MKNFPPLATFIFPSWLQKAGQNLIHKTKN